MSALATETQIAHTVKVDTTTSIPPISQEALLNYRPSREMTDTLEV